MGRSTIDTPWSRLFEDEDDDEDEYDYKRRWETRASGRMNTELLSLLRCPETGGVLRTATPAELERVNVAIRSSGVRNRAGELISDPVENCLICDSAGLCYPVRDGLPLMLAGEAFDTPR